MSATERLGDWLAGNFALLLLLLGVLLILIGVTTRLDAPILERIVADTDFQRGPITIGLVFVVVATALRYIVQNLEPSARLRPSPDGLA